MPKEPKDLPMVHCRVSLRGRNASGLLAHVNPKTKWCRVDWDVGKEGPEIVHLHELQIETT